MPIVCSLIIPSESEHQVSVVHYLKSSPILEKDMSLPRLLYHEYGFFFSLLTTFRMRCSPSQILYSWTNRISLYSAASITIKTQQRIRWINVQCTQTLVYSALDNTRGVVGSSFTDVESGFRGSHRKTSGISVDVFKQLLVSTFLTITTSSMLGLPDQKRAAINGQLFGRYESMGKHLESTDVSCSASQL